MHLFIYFLLILCFSNDEVIGIDFGASSLCVGVFIDGNVRIINNEFGNTVTASAVSINNDGIYCGDNAKQQMIYNPNNTLYAMQKLIGYKYDDINMMKYIDTLPFKIVKDTNQLMIEITFINGSNFHYSLDKIASILLRKMKYVAQNYLKKEIKKAVIAVPSYFNEDQYDLIKKASFDAEFLSTKIIKEPIAAAIAYEPLVSKKIIVFHLGGYNCDVSVLSTENSTFKIINSQNSDDVNGEKINDKITHYLLQKFGKKWGNKASEDLIAVAKLKVEVEKAKKILSLIQKTVIIIDNFYDGITFYEELTRDEFEKINNDLFQKSLTIIQNVLKSSNLSKNEISNVLLVGGSTKIPKIQEIISNFFNETTILANINQDEVVAYGAALEGICMSLNFNTNNIIHLIPYTFGIKTNKGEYSIFINENTHFPFKKSKQILLPENNQNNFKFDIFMSDNDQLLDKVFIETIKLTNLNEKVHIVNITFFLFENCTLKVSVFVNKKEKLNKIINLDENTLKQKNFQMLRLEISEKVNEISKYYDQQMKEFDKMRRKYADKAHWFINDVTSEYEIIQKMNDDVNEIFEQHFEKLFPTIYKRYSHCIIQERMEYAYYDF